MWKTLSAVVAVLIILTGSACQGRREKAKLPDAEIAAAIPVASPLPAFREMYRAIESINPADYAKLPKVTPFPTNLSPDKRVYALGTLLCDATNKTKGHDKQGLQAVVKQIGVYLDTVFTPDEKSQLVTALSNTISMPNWEDIDAAMDGLRKRIEDRLWEKEKYDSYTLFALGTWTRALESVTLLLHGDDPEAARLSKPQIDIWQLLASNLRMISDPQLRESEQVKSALMQVEDIHKLMVTREKSSLNIGDIQLIQTMCAKIHSQYLK